MNVFERLIYTEYDPGDDNPWIRPLGFVWGILTACLLYGILFLFGSYDMFYKLCAYFREDEQRMYFFWIFIAFTAFGFFYRGYYAIMGLLNHDKKTGIHLDNRYILFAVRSNIAINVIMGIVYAFIGFLFLLLGYNFQDALVNSFDFNFIFSKAEILLDKVPTVFHLNYFAALLLAHLIPSLAEYIWHRLSHESRLLWLLAHRNHHISTTLSSATVFEADPRFALGLIWKTIMTVIVPGIIAKLFYGNGYLFIELALLRMLWGTLEIHNHTSAYYEDIRKNKILWPLMVLTGSGPYHIIHHSSDPKHTVANIGGGLFLIWDRVFGTYVHPPMQLPKLGLTNQPEIYLNHWNFALSGVLQIIYELRHNPGINMKFKILFGNIYFIPPHTKSYLIKDEKAYYNAEEKVAQHSSHLEIV